jgi:hypothetical protein
MAGNPDFPIGTAAASWFDKSGQLHIRVYSCDGYEITERCNDGHGWVNGFVCTGSQASVTVWSDSAGEHIRLYATYQNNTTEWCNDPGTSGWTTGSYTKP